MKSAAVMLLLVLLVALAFGQTYKVDNFGGPIISVVQPQQLGANEFNYSENLLAGPRSRYSRPGIAKAFSSYVGSNGVDAAAILDACDSVWAIMLTGSVWYYTSIGSLDKGGAPGVGRDWLANWNTWRQLWARVQGSISTTSGNKIFTGASNGTRFIRDLYSGDSIFAADDSTFLGEVAYISDDDYGQFKATSPHTHSGTYFVRRAFKSGRNCNLTHAYGNLYATNGINHPQEIFCSGDSLLFMRKLGIVDTVLVKYASMVFPDSAKTAPYVDENGWTSISDTNFYDHTTKLWDLDSGLGNARAAYFRYFKVVDSSKAWATNEWAGFIGDSITGANLYYFAFYDYGDGRPAPATESHQLRYLPIIANTPTTLYMQAPVADSGAARKYIDSNMTTWSLYAVEDVYWGHQAFNNGQSAFSGTRGYIVAVAGGGEVVYESKGTILARSRAGGCQWKFDTTGTGIEDFQFDRGIYYFRDMQVYRSNGIFSGGKCNYCRPAQYNPWMFIRNQCVVGDSVIIMTTNMPDTSYNVDTTSFWQIVKFDVPHFDATVLYQDELVGWGDTNSAAELIHTRTTVRGPEPDNWSTEGSFVASRTGEAVTALYPYDDRLFYWTENTTNALLGDFATGTVQEIAIGIGTMAPRSVVGWNKWVYFLHQDDYYRIARRDFEGYTLQPMTAQIHNVMTDIYGSRRFPSIVRHPMNNAYRHLAASAIDPQLQRVWLFYPETSFTYNNVAVSLDIERDIWDGYHTLGASQAFPYTYKDTLRLFMTSATNGMWTYWDGSFMDTGNAFQTALGGNVVAATGDTVTAQPIAFWLRHAVDITGDTISAWPEDSVYGTARLILNGDDGRVVDTLRVDGFMWDTTSAGVPIKGWGSTLFHGRTDSAGAARVWKWELKWNPDAVYATSLWEPMWMTIEFKPMKAGQD